MAGFDLREEEEELVGVDPIAKGVEIASKIKAKSNAHTPRAVKNQIGLESLNPDNVTGGAAQSQQDKAEGKQPNVKDSFFEAVSFFLPTIIGGAVGSIIGGDEGLVEGAKMGEKAGTGYAKYKQAKQARQDKLNASGASVAQQRLNISKSNLEIRKEELQEQKKRTGNLANERSDRREERDVDRAIKTKQQFAGRVDIKNIKDKFALLNDMQDILNDAPEIASGVIGFKIAKGIAGEVGNLTQAEREAAQVSPSFYRNLVRGGTKFLTGALPKEDVKELNKIVAVLRKKAKGRLGNKINAFSKSRSKSFSDRIKKDFENDLRLEHGLVDTNTGFSRAEIDAMKDKLRKEKARRK